MLNFVANFLNTNFYEYDYSIIKAIHENFIINIKISRVIASIVSLLGEKCILYLLSGVIIFFIFKKKKMGISVFISVCVMIVLCEFILKNTIMRIRPFLATEEFKYYWEMVSGPVKDSFSCPSSHCAGASAVIFAMYFNKKSFKILFFGFIFLILMMYSRVFLVVHYPTDCILGIIFGLISAIIGSFIGNKIYKIIKK